MNPRGNGGSAALPALVATAAALIWAPAANAQAPQPFAPYDGSNPFHCELQDVGTGTDFPDPKADPFCVKFDKTNQNVTDFGIADFLAQEPARTAAAAPKCFYYQSDEWTGSIMQGSEPETWHWVGGYFFDKAHAVGGVSVRDFRVGGQPASFKPYTPPEYQPYVDDMGGGGVQVQMATIGEPDCLAKVDTPEERTQVFKDESAINDCIEPGGGIHKRRLGRVKLGARRSAVRGLLGDPDATKGRADTWCVVGGDYLQVVFRGSPGSAALVRTTVRGQTVDRIGTGSDSKRALRRLELTRVFRLGGTRVFELDGRRGSQVLVGLGPRRVRWMALANPHRIRSEAALRRALSAAIG